jgi:hypothetical protein
VAAETGLDAVPDDGLVEVRLLGVPLALRARYVEHDQDLVRELSLVRLGAEQEHEHDRPAHVPDRLLALAAELETTYLAFTAGQTQRMDEALEAGAETFDAVYRVPPQAGPFAHRLGEALEEAEEWCRSGHYLLTVSATPDLVAYRRWVIGEFERQIAGETPRPWSQVVQEAEQGETVGGGARG